MWMKDAASWLDMKFLDWQTSHGKRKTLTQFADYLGISQSLLSHYMNGTHSPSGENVEKIALRLGDEIYAILGLPTPDLQLRTINRLWGQIPPEQRQKLIDQAQDYATQNATRQNNDLRHTT